MGGGLKWVERTGWSELGGTGVLVAVFFGSRVGRDVVVPGLMGSVHRE